MWQGRGSVASQGGGGMTQVLPKADTQGFNRKYESPRHRGSLTPRGAGCLKVFRASLAIKRGPGAVTQGEDPQTPSRGADHAKAIGRNSSMYGSPHIGHPRS